MSEYAVVRAQNEANFQDLQNMMKKYQGKLNIQLADNSQMIDVIGPQVRNGTAPYPVIGACCGYEYIVEEECTTYKAMDLNGKEHIYEFDYVQSMPIYLYPSFTILATDVSQMIEMENFLLNEYSNTHTLTFEHPNKPGESISFDLELYDPAIERSTATFNGVTCYQSILKVISYFCPSFWPSFHPAEIAFEQTKQLEIVIKLKAVCELIESCENKGTPMLIHGFPRKWEEYGYTPTEAELELRAKHRALCKIRNDMEDALPFDQEIKSELGSYDRIYKKMSESGCDIPGAVAAEKKEIEEKIARYDRKKQQEAEERAARASYQYFAPPSEPQPSSGGLLRRAVNAALEPNKPSPYKDLMGAVGCQYAKKRYCMGCGLYWHCSRGIGGKR